MIGDMIAKIRKEKGITKTELARRTGINIGHLTHIEKGERNPSQNALKNICQALDTPYQPLMYTYGKTLSEEQEAYGFINYIAYNKVIAVDSMDKLIPCPSHVPSSALAIKMEDDSMEPAIKKGDYVFVEFNTLLNNKEFGLFNLNGKFLIRKFHSRNGQITLKADNKSVNDVKVNNNDDFSILGRVFV